MGLETVVNIADLVAANPPGTDPESQGANHLRNLKTALLNDFAGMTGAVTVSGTDGGVANAYTLTPANALVAYGSRMAAVFVPIAANNGASTLNISGLGAKALLRVDGTALVANDLLKNSLYVAWYDGTNFKLIAPTKQYVDQLAFSAALPAQPGDSILRYLQTLNGLASWSVITVPYPPGFINGFTLSNDGTTPNSVLDIAAGNATDSTNAVSIAGTTFTKSTAGAWAAGSGGNGMGNGLTIANSTWYHVFAIINAGAYDVYFDTSPTAANKPAGTTAFRYIGSFKTDGSAHILAFVQKGQYFYWQAQVLDLNNGSSATATLFTVSTPLGFETVPLLTARNSNGSAANAEIWSPAMGATIPYQNVTSGAGALYIPVDGYMTNTSSQLYYAISAAGLDVRTNGYINPHVAPTF